MFPQNGHKVATNFKTLLLNSFRNLASKSLGSLSHEVSHMSLGLSSLEIKGMMTELLALLYFNLSIFSEGIKLSKTPKESDHQEILFPLVREKECEKFFF